MPAVSEVPECPLCFGRLLPLSVCHACNTVSALDRLEEVTRELTCEECGATNPSHFVCSACHSRFPFEDVVKPAGPARPACKSPGPLHAGLGPHCNASPP